MNIVQNIEKIAKNQGLTLTEIERRCGFSKSSIRKWSENIPNIQKVISVSEILNVSLDFLIFGSETFNSSLTKDESSLLVAYNSVDELSKALIMERAAVLAELEAAKKKDTVKITLKQSSKQTETEEITEPEYISLPFPALPALPASAGVGEYLHEDTTSYIKVPATNLTQRSSFALRVHGDSMEPDYFDGDIVLVDADADVNVGDVGIFIVNGEGFIKQRGKDRLISLNNKYKDIRISADDTCVCKGKVIGSL